MRPVLSILALLNAVGCGASYDPGTVPTDYQALVSNPLLPFPAGARWVYEGMKGARRERIEVEVLSETKAVAWGVQATVVRDVALLDGAKVEETLDWYAQHKDGSVWYMGEDTAEYEGGQVVSHDGAWEAGVDGALPGIVMPAAPTAGQRYRQEYYAGEAEDEGEVEAVELAATVPAGSFTGCVRTHDTSALDDTLDERKTYCPGVGLVLVEEADGRLELIERRGL